MTTAPLITTHPGVRSGQPTLNGTGLLVESVAGTAWTEGVAAACHDYGLSRAAVLVCCWYAGTYGLPGDDRELAATPEWRDRWARWAAQVGDNLARNTAGELIPDPPSQRAASLEAT